MAILNFNRTSRAAFVLMMPLLLVPTGTALAEGLCAAEQPEPLVPTDIALCETLDPAIRRPGDLPLGEYEQALGLYLRNFCHRRPDIGWVPDKHVRDTGPYTSAIVDGQWQGTYHGTHAPVLIWYSPEMAAWVRANRRPQDEGPGPDKAPVPEGAVLVKEMYPAPASRCANADPMHLLPLNGATVMVRQQGASHDGWFWGWFGWSGWDPDYPASNVTNRLPNMGFGQYCLNCHASARDNFTFASERNMKGSAAELLAFLSMDDGGSSSRENHHRSVVQPDDAVRRLGSPLYAYDPDFSAAFPNQGPPPTWNDVPMMPSATYDNVFAPAGAPPDHGQFLTSDQCIGCHDAGTTGLHFDMTEVEPETGKLRNLSPYATWRTSPMGMAGRDPIFFAQLASETQSFHPDAAGTIENICLGCHGVMGQRQFAIDKLDESGACGVFSREDVNAVPYPPFEREAALASYGALARDGISCMACHQMSFGDPEIEADSRNTCVRERQEALNPGLTGFARTFTGSFPVGKADKLIGPFAEPRQIPMKTALGLIPEHDTTIGSSEICGTCHTVHLPVLWKGKTVGRVYEQTTYPEWAFSAYRTGTTPEGMLPYGKGAKAESCQGCHMRSTEPDGSPTRSKIASIQEFTGFPETDFIRPPSEIDLPVREGFARHTLVGLNVFFMKMAQQFPDVLGIRSQDPMLVSKGIDPLIATEQAMLKQAASGTATVSVGKVDRSAATLDIPITVTSLTGHKFPSGVGFRRAFLTVEVMDARGNVLWGSGRTDSVGRIVDAEGQPLPGEMWWEPDCSARIDPLARQHQPHYQRVIAQDQAQIYQELVSTPGDGPNPICGHDATPEGQLTTSFLSICAEAKDNRILPSGYLPLEARIAIAEALGAGKDLAEDAGSTAVGNDPDYVTGGGDSLIYSVALADLDGKPATVRAQLFYQATPPFYLQDRFCSAEGPDRDRLYFLSGHVNLDGTEAEDWKLLIADTGAVAIASED